MGWTDDRVEVLKKLWGQGFSCSQIASQLGGVTRNAVIGKVSRLRLPSRRTASSTPRKKRAPKPALPKLTFSNQATIPWAGKSSQPVDYSAFKANGEDYVTFDHLPKSGCKWPFDDEDGNHLGYCGATKEAGSYCPKHAHMALHPSLRKAASKKSVRAA